MDIKFLIIIAYYNRPEIVKNALNSIVDLNYDNYEVAFVDDGSEAKGEDIVTAIFPQEILDKTSFYRCDDTAIQKQQQGGRTRKVYAITNNGKEYVETYKGILKEQIQKEDIK